MSVTYFLFNKGVVFDSLEFPTKGIPSCGEELQPSKVCALLTIVLCLCYIYVSSSSKRWLGLTEICPFEQMMFLQKI